MGASTSYRKRGNDFFKSCSHISKRRNLSVYTPINNSRIGFYFRVRNLLTTISYNITIIGKLGNFLGILYRSAKAKNTAMEKLRLSKRKKKVVVEKKEETKVHKVMEIDDYGEEEKCDDDSDESFIETLDAVEFKAGRGSRRPDVEMVKNELHSCSSDNLDVCNSIAKIDDSKLCGLNKSDNKLSSLKSNVKLKKKKRRRYRTFRSILKELDIKDQIKKEECFMPLTDEEEREIVHAFKNSNRGNVLVSHKGSNINITGDSLQCLRPQKWLGDEVINVYLGLLQEREMREPQKFVKCHFFNTFFYELINRRGGYDYESVQRWTAQGNLGYNLLHCDKIFVPIHQKVHWCLAVINKKEEKFQYLDSLKRVDSEVLNVLARYYVDEVKDKTGEDIDVSWWEREYVRDLPEQKNGFDCGVFMIKYADFYSKDMRLCFSQKDMPYFRKRTAKEILKLRAD